MGAKGSGGEVAMRSALHGESKPKATGWVLSRRRGAAGIGSMYLILC